MTIFEEPPLRDELRGQVPYAWPRHEAAVRLDSNTSPLPLPDVVAEAVEKALHGVLRDLHRYPDADVSALREDLAAHLGHGLGVANVWVGNGSSEMVQEVLQAFGGPGRTAMGFAPSYPVHPRLAVVTGTGWMDGHRGVGFDLTVEAARAQVRVYQPDVVLLCSPNNPTGAAVGLDVVRAVLEETAGMVIVDEAYIDFARPGVQSAVSLLPHYPRLVVTRSMSKVFALAGARVGYLAARPAVVEALQLVRLPYPLSSLAQATARAVLANASALQPQVEAVKQQRERLIAAMRELGIMVLDSDANFVLFGASRDERAVWQALLARGVLVREVGLAGYLRVSIGTPEENDAFLNAIASLRTR